MIYTIQTSASLFWLSKRPPRQESTPSIYEKEFAIALDKQGILYQFAPEQADEEIDFLFSKPFLSLDAARWHMVKDAISHGYTWFVVKYV